MTAALEWIDLAPLPESDHTPEQVWDTHRCRAMWVAGLRMYILDAQAAMNEHKPPRCKAEALDDLTSEGAPMLAHLCKWLDLELGPTQAGIVRLIDSGQRLRLG